MTRQNTPDSLPIWRVLATGWIAGRYCQKGAEIELHPDAAKYENVAPATAAPADKPAKK